MQNTFSLHIPSEDIKDIKETRDGFPKFPRDPYFPIQNITYTALLAFTAIRATN
jgi:hypothetical protein